MRVWFLYIKYLLVGTINFIGDLGSVVQYRVATRFGII